MKFGVIFWANLLPCPQSGAGYYILSVSYPARRAAQGIIFYQVLLSSSCPAGAAAGLCFRFFLLSGNTSFSYTSWHPISTKLGHSDQYLNYYSGTNNDGVRGHDGVTGVKNVMFHGKCYFSYRLHGMVMWLKHKHQLYTLYKSYGSRNPPGVIWGHRVKRSFLPKMLFLLQITCHGHVTHIYWSARYPLQKLWV